MLFRSKWRDEERESIKGYLSFFFDFPPLSLSLITVSHWKRPMRIYNISFSVVHTTIQRTLNHGGDREYVYTYIYIYLFVFRERTRGSVGTLPLVHLPPPPRNQ